jgi:hypothetical protein
MLRCLTVLVRLQKAQTHRSRHFGMRISPEDMAADGQGQTKRVRVAVDMTEEAATVGGGEAEVLPFLIDQVDLGVSGTGQLALTVPSRARLFVYTKT